MSDTLIQPYLFFAGRCQEALDFYKSAIGAQVEFVMLFKDSPAPPPPDVLQSGFENKIMHSTFRVGASTVMASDGCNDDASKFEGFKLSLSVQTVAEADRAFNALAEGGNITMPLSQTFWSPRFGMVTDRFGVAWMVTVAQPPQ